MTWQQVIGHKAVIENLKQQVKAGHIGHAYLFVGAHGIGKRKVAELFAAEILCCDQFRKNSNVDKIECEQRVSGNKHPDIWYLETEKNTIGVLDIRNWKKNIWLPPTLAQKKFFIIDESEKLTVQAQNALLKVLEEPPADTIFVFLTNNISKILPTVLSRCSIIRFNPLSEAEIREVLDKHNITNDEINFLVHFVNGSPGRAIELAKHKDINMMVDAVVNIIKALSTKDCYQLVRLADEISKYDVNMLLYFLQELWAKALRRDQTIHGIINKDITYFSNRKLWDLHRDCQLIAVAGKQIRQYLNKQLVLETLFLKLLEDSHG